MTPSFLTYYQKTKKIIERDLVKQCSAWEKDLAFPTELKQAMSYSLLAGGKRLRPFMTHFVFDVMLLPFFALKKSKSEISQYKKAISTFAICLEMLHTYSLIHDDLPAMDNDDLRRGLPTCHKKYGEDLAILAGDALQSQAFFLLASLGSSLGKKKINYQDLCSLLAALAHAIGPRGMAGGQVRDILNEHKKKKTEKEKLLKNLHLTHMQKTGALIEISLLAPLYLFKSTLPISALLNPLKKTSEMIGLAFQIVDDILDETSDTKTLGKNARSDIKNCKETFTTLLGIEESKLYLSKLEKKNLLEIKKIENIEKKIKRSLVRGKNVGGKNQTANAPNPKTMSISTTDTTGTMLTALWDFVVKRNH